MCRAGSRISLLQSRNNLKVPLGECRHNFNDGA